MQSRLEVKETQILLSVNLTCSELFQFSLLLLPHSFINYKQMDYRQHLITLLHKNTGTEFWVFWSHCVFLAIALAADCNNC